MEVVILCITLTAIMCVCLVAIGYVVGREVNDDVIDKGTTQRTNDVDSDIRVYVMRMSVRYSEVERLAIDYCIDRLEAENG